MCVESSFLIKKRKEGNTMSMSMTINQATQQDYFEKAYNYILRDNDVPGTARLLYLTLSSYAKEDTCYVSIKRLAKDLSCCHETVRKYLRWLQSHGFITITHRKKKNSLENDTNLYTISRDKELWDYSNNNDMKKTDAATEQTLSASISSADKSAEENDSLLKTNAEHTTCSCSELEINNHVTSIVDCLKFYNFEEAYINLIEEIMYENLNLVEPKKINKVLYQPIAIRTKLLSLSLQEITGSLVALEEACKKQSIPNPRSYLLSILMRAHGDEIVKHLTKYSCNCKF